MTIFTTTVGLLSEIDQDPDLGGYRVVHMRHGNAVFGPIPIGDLLALSSKWQEEMGFDLWELGVAGAINATYCATDKEGAAAWREEVDRGARERAGGDDELAWIWGTDVGLSSMTILYVLGQSTAARTQVNVRFYRTRSAIGARPSDPGDLGRCVRLLDRFPGWRERLGEVAAAHPAWAPLVEVWAELEDLYREEKPTGTAPRTYDRMRQLLGEEEG